MKRFSLLALLCLMAVRLEAQVIINEIMYHPAETTGEGMEDKRYEWIELYNDTADPVDLSDCYFSEGIDFTFPVGTYLGGKSYLVVCANQSAVRAKYGITATIGNWDDLTALDNSGEPLALVNISGVVLSRVSYNDRNRWPAGADGTGHSLALLTPYSDPEDPDSWALSPTPGGSPGAPNFVEEGGPSYSDQVLINDNEVWSYFKGTEEPPADWNELSFAGEGAWESGPTGIGYGDNDDATNLDDMRNSYLTVYCRKKFTIDDASGIEDLVLSITYDDGFYAYLNGTQVASRNTLGKNFDDTADNAIEPTREDIDISAFKNLLRDGPDNLLAVQVHNANYNSSDLSFIPKLVSRTVTPPVAPVIINEALIRTSGERWVELFNDSDSQVDLSGYHITDDRTDLTRATLGPGTVISPRQRLAFSDQSLGLNFSLQDPEPRERVFVALVDPAGNRVLDAYTFKPLYDELSEARIPDGNKRMMPAADPTRGDPNVAALVGGGDIVINEIMYHPISGDTRDEYLEIFNRGENPVNLLGFEFDKGVNFVFPDVELAGGEYLVVAHDPERIRQRYGLPPEKVLGPEQDEESLDHFGVLRDDGELVELLDPSGNIADMVRYHDGGEWAHWADGRGSSLELIDPFQDNNNPHAWDASDDSSKSRPKTFTYNSRHHGGESELQLMLLDRGITIVDDISLKAGTTEYISNGTFNTSTTGWRLEGTHLHSGRTDDPDLVINGNGSLKIAATRKGDYKINRIETNPDLPALSTSTTYTIQLTARWIVGARVLLTRGYNCGLSLSHHLEVPENLGTPGAINSVTARQINLYGSANIGPVIDKVRHLPVVPGGGEPVTVVARVRDSDGVLPGSVKLHYAINTPPASLAGFTTLDMTGPDAEDRYRATILGQGQGTIILFFVTALDNSPQKFDGRYPIDHTQRTHPILLDPLNPSTNDLRYVLYRHDTRLPSTRYLNYRFVLHQANQDYLWNRPVQSNDLVDGTFIFEADRAYYNSRMRWSGSPWLRGRNWGNSYRVRLPGDDLLHGRIKSFNLENHSTDGRERISHHLLRYQNLPGVKVPYALQWYARWQVNNEVNRTYEHVPQPDNEYITMWFPEGDNGDFFELDDRFEFNDDGNKVSNRDARLTYPPYPSTSNPVADPENDYLSWKENYRWYFNVRARPNDDDFTNLIEFSRVLDTSKTASSQFDEIIWDYADVESMLRVWAIRMNTDDWDTWGTNRGKNCYLYRRSSDGRWVLIPWDMELTYGSTGWPLIPVNQSLFPEVYRMFTRPIIARRYYGILKEMVDHQFNSDFLTPWMNLLQANGTGSTEKGRSGDFIDDRADIIRNSLRSYVYPTQRLIVTTNQGNPYKSPQSTISIAGYAPVEVYEILVTRDGELLDPQPEVAFTNIKGWVARDIPLLDGDNDLGFFGFTANPGEMIDSDTILITYSGDWMAPVVTGVEPASAFPGETVVITGTDFHDGLRVNFGGRLATTVTFDEDTDPGHITVQVPSNVSPGRVDVKVTNSDNQASNTYPMEILERVEFIRGDANRNTLVEMGDVIKIVFHLFQGQTVDCEDALDADDNEKLELTDAILVLNFLFLAGDAPAAPYPGQGADPAGDGLGCNEGL